MKKTLWKTFQKRKWGCKGREQFKYSRSSAWLGTELCCARAKKMNNLKFFLCREVLWCTSMEPLQAELLLLIKMRRQGMMVCVCVRGPWNLYFSDLMAVLRRPHPSRHIQIFSLDVREGSVGGESMGNQGTKVLSPKIFSNNRVTSTLTKVWQRAHVDRKRVLLTEMISMDWNDPTKMCSLIIYHKWSY